MFPCRVIKRQNVLLHFFFFFFTLVFTNVTIVPRPMNVLRWRPPCRRVSAFSVFPPPHHQQSAIQTRVFERLTAECPSSLKVISPTAFTFLLYTKTKWRTLKKRNKKKEHHLLTSVHLDGPIKRQRSRPWEWVSRIQVTVQ